MYGDDVLLIPVVRGAAAAAGDSCSMLLANINEPAGLFLDIVNLGDRWWRWVQ